MNTFEPISKDDNNTSSDEEDENAKVYIFYRPYTKIRSLSIRLYDIFNIIFKLN